MFKQFRNDHWLIGVWGILTPVGQWFFVAQGAIVRLGNFSSPKNAVQTLHNAQVAVG